MPWSQGRAGSRRLHRPDAAVARVGDRDRGQRRHGRLSARAHARPRDGASRRCSSRPSTSPSCATTHPNWPLIIVFRAGRGRARTARSWSSTAGAGQPRHRTSLPADHLEPRRRLPVPAGTGGDGPPGRLAYCIAGGTRCTERPEAYRARTGHRVRMRRHRRFAPAADATNSFFQQVADQMLVDPPTCTRWVSPVQPGRGAAVADQGFTRVGVSSGAGRAASATSRSTPTAAPRSTRRGPLRLVARLGRPATADTMVPVATSPESIHVVATGADSLP